MRNQQIDIVRVLSVLYIVGFWHLIGYMNPEICRLLTNPYTSNIVNSVLGTFMFVSGFCLAKYKFATWYDAWSFYKKRLGRFYILFFISALTMWVGGMIPTVQQFLGTITAIAPYVGDSPKTLWFFSILIGFYLITPLLNRQKHDIAITLVVVFLYSLLLYLNPLKDIRLLYCFPCYLLGLKIGRYFTIDFVNKCSLYGLTLVIYIYMIYSGNSGLSVYYVDVLTGVMSIMFLGYLFAKIPMPKLVEWISYASMCAYLFHRHIYRAGRFIFSAEDGGFPWWFAFFIILPITFIVSFYIQKMYDKYLVRRKDSVK